MPPESHIFQYNQKREQVSAWHEICLFSVHWCKTKLVSNYPIFYGFDKTIYCQICNKRGLERWVPLGFWCFGQLSHNRFFDLSDVGGKKRGKKKRIIKIMATTSLPAVNRLEVAPHARAKSIRHYLLLYAPFPKY